jgi:hypothetical protein
MRERGLDEAPSFLPRTTPTIRDLRTDRRRRASPLCAAEPSVSAVDSVPTAPKLPR